MSRCYLFDLDGTVADVSHRLHHIQGEKKDWRAFFAACHLDLPIQPIVYLIKQLQAAGANIIYVSGRSDECQPATAEWLCAQGIGSLSVYMRAAGDHRPDDIVKGELLDRILADGWQPILVFDDRASVVKMWRSRGFVCAQVAEGEF